MIRSKKYDLIVVGAGIIGTFCALHALQQKKSVLLIEKNDVPFDSSFRDLGQLIPSSLPTQKWFEHGRTSLKIYKDLHELSDISFCQQGSWYLASDQQEMQLLEEMGEILNDRSFENRIYSAKDCLASNPHFNADFLKGGMYLPDEASINPSQMIHRIREYLIRKFALHFMPNTAVIGVEKKRGIAKLVTANQQTIWADHIIIASGKDTQFLLPEYYQENQMKIGKLQLMRLAPQSKILKSNILSGLTIRQVQSFQPCPSHLKLTTDENQQKMIAKGIDIKIKQADDGSIILGNSLEFAPLQTPSDLGFENSAGINQLILDEAKKILHLTDWTVDSTWIGTYLKNSDNNVMIKKVEPVIHIINGVGGIGLTVGPSLTAEFIDKLYE